MSERSFMKRLNQLPARTLITLATLSSALLLAIASPVLAGGFQLSVETPARSTDHQLKDIVLIARTYGCHQPADAKLSATAEGFVNGKRKSLPLELRSIGSGVYGIKQQWPSEGTWVLALTGAYNGMTSSVLVELGPNGNILPGTRLDEGNLKGVHAKGARRSWIAAEIDSALQTPAGLTSDAPSKDDASSTPSFGPITLLVAGLGASVFTIGFVTRSRRGTAEKVSSP
ncbi:MAG: hypothetical protein AABN33_10035 [Acidobacteriota bacterium]